MFLTGYLSFFDIYIAVDFFPFIFAVMNTGPAIEENLCGSGKTLSIEDVFSSIERLTGLEVSVYSPLQGAYSLKKLPMIYQRHMSEFCRTVKANRARVGCGGHDSHKMTEEARKRGKPFVNICHAGIAEVIIPVFGIRKAHIATIFIGQAVTEDVETAGFRNVATRVEKLGVDERKLKQAFELLPHISRKSLLDFGCLVDIVLRNFFEEKGAESFEREIRLAGNPAIKRALDIIEKTEDFSDLTESGIARKVFLNPAYFSRLFKKIMKRNFTDYMTEKKINVATSLLHTTDLSIMEIAHICGYARQSYFTRVFRASTGISPSRYRKNKP